jgi:hypothetical protein
MTRTYYDEDSGEWVEVDGSAAEGIGIAALTGLTVWAVLILLAVNNLGAAAFAAGLVAFVLLVAWWTR